MTGKLRRGGPAARTQEAACGGPPLSELPSPHSFLGNPLPKSGRFGALGERRSLGSCNYPKRSNACPLAAGLSSAPLIRSSLLKLLGLLDPKGGSGTRGLARPLATMLLPAEKEGLARALWVDVLPFGSLVLASKAPGPKLYPSPHAHSSP